MMRTVRAILHVVCLVLGMGSTTSWAESVEKLSLKPPDNMTRADLYYWEGNMKPRAVLVLSPGCNGNGRGLVQQEGWQAYARSHDLGLVGLSFASPMGSLGDGTGYYYASCGSGEILLKGIRKIYGKDLPLLLYGFSGGAHFTSRFVEWSPERVISWCAYSAAWWDEPLKQEAMPPGIVACGEQDPRLGASLVYFKQGRAVGKPWLWVELAGIGHSGSRELDGFVRDYFAMVLERADDALWVDIDRENVVETAEATREPSISGWLPSAKLLKGWRGVSGS